MLNIERTRTSCQVSSWHLKNAAQTRGELLPLYDLQTSQLPFMWKGFNSKHLRLVLIPAVALTGTTIIYSRQTSTWAISERLAVVTNSLCTVLPTPDSLSLAESDEITIGVPVDPHNYRSDGILEVSPSASHPIHDLIAEAENKWHSKQNRASQNIQQAFYEYRRRYGRLPPKGFDKW